MGNLKVVINTCFGGFGPSKEALEWMAARGHTGAIEALARGSSEGSYYLYPLD